VDKVVILWTANTEETIETIPNLQQLERLIEKDAKIPSSVLYAYASMMEGVTYLNGSPQNTLHPAILELAEKQNACIAGADFKSGQTRFKTVMGDFFTGCGIKLSSIVSYNHLGNNDGKNLNESHTFKSKEQSKSGCLDDQIVSNEALYPKGNDLDHVVVIKYVPFVGDSKRALDEYSSRIFLGGVNTISSYNVCEDSLLAVPLMIDMVLLAEFFSRVTIDGKKMGPVLSYLSFFFKAPITNRGEHVVNSFTKQREMLCNLLKATQGY